MDGQDKKKILAWALYDWANSAYATTVIAGFFPIFFKQYWSNPDDPAASTLHLGLANSLSSLVLVVLAPVLGAIADRAGVKKRFLILFTVLGIVMTGAMPLVGRGEWELAAALYVLANIGFSGGIVFYDSLIVSVADRRRLDTVSAYGYALGYLGGGLLFGFNVAMTLAPQSFGLADAGEAVRLSFVTVAVWWGVFSVPLMLWVEEPAVRTTPGALEAVRGGLRQLAATFQEVRRLRQVFWFLIGYWLYIDGVDTVVRMAVDYGLSIGFAANNLIVALLITQFVGFPAALAFGRLGERYGTKRGIFVALAAYVAICLYATVMDSIVEFFALAVAIGLVQGGIQALSRSLYARLIPAGKSGEFFGFYNMLGKFAAIFGPVLMGWASVATGNPRWAILTVVVLFILGGLCLARVDEAEGQRVAREMDSV